MTRKCENTPKNIIFGESEYGYYFSYIKIGIYKVGYLKQKINLKKVTTKTPGGGADLPPLGLLGLKKNRVSGATRKVALGLRDRTPDRRKASYKQPIFTYIRKLHPKKPKN